MGGPSWPARLTFALWLGFLHPEGDAAGQRDGVIEDVEPLAVLVREGHADLGKPGFLVLPLADAVGDKRGLLAGGGGRGGCSSVMVLLLVKVCSVMSREGNLFPASP